MRFSASARPGDIRQTQREPVTASARTKKSSAGRSSRHYHCDPAKRHVCHSLCYLRFLLTVAAISSAAWMIFEFIS